MYKQKYDEMISDMKSEDESTKKVPVTTALTRVNQFFNKMTYVSDYKQHGLRDHWSSLNELLESGKGDCEDFAIAKFMALKEIGFPEDTIYLSYVATENNEAHMVLFYYYDKEYPPLVLDNLIDKILVMVKRKLHPIYIFNDTDLYLVNSEGVINSDNQGPPVLKKWDQMLGRTINNVKSKG